MMGRAARPLFRRDERAVSQIVGAILLFALIATGFVVVRSTYLPAWEERDEALHMERMRESFANMKAEAERRVDNASSAAGSVVVRLAPTERSVWSSREGDPGQLAFIADGADVSLSTTEFRLQSNNGTSTFATSETWTQIQNGGDIEDIASLKHLRIRITDPEGAADAQGVTLTVYDADNDYAGEIEVYNDDYPSGYAIKVRVRDADSEILYDQGEGSFAQNQPAFFWVDALEDPYQFTDVLAATQGPFRLELSEQGLTGHYSVAYVEQTADGSVLVGDAGVLLSPWSTDYPGGSIRFDSLNVRMPDERYILEHGALLVVQGSSSVLAIAPPVKVAVVGSTTTMQIVLPDLVGAPDARMERGAFTVDMASTGHTELLGTAPRFTLEFATDHPSAWTSWWTRHLEATGMTASAGHFSISSDADSVTVTVFGLTTPPASTVHDLSIDLRRAAVSVSFGD